MLWRFLRLFFALFLSQVLLFFVFLFVVGAMVATLAEDEPVLLPHTALVVELYGDVIEYPTLPTLPYLQETPLSQTAILEGLERAAVDSKVDGVLFDLGASTLGWGKATELRGAIERFRGCGKPVWAFGTYLDEMGLYLASACDSVYLPPHGKLALNGLAFGALYYKGLFDKLGLRANVHRIGAYKDAVEPYVRSGMSEASREQAGWLLEEIWGEFQSGVAASRRVEPESLAAALASGTLQPAAAVARGFIDGVRQRQELVDALAGDDGPVLGMARYHAISKAPHTSISKTIAVVHTRGLILAGKNSYHPAVGTILGEDSVVEDLEDAAGDDQVAAIVLRIDSPGGEVLASDAIGAAVQRAGATKPIVVSMVDVAASGGYMMAYRADRILALPTTITGSIGSITGKLNAQGLYAKLGLSKDFVTRGQYPLLFSDYHDWSAEEESLVARQHWQDYDQWIADIAARRTLAVADVDSVARGRVWSGRQALERRLVDEIGDMQRAIELAQELAGLEAGTRARVVHYPKPVGLLQALREERLSLFSAAVERWAQRVALPQGATWSVLEFGRVR